MSLDTRNVLLAGQEKWKKHLGISMSPGGVQQAIQLRTKMEDQGAKPSEASSLIRPALSISSLFFLLGGLGRD